MVPDWSHDPHWSGGRLRTVREAAGLSQQALAWASGIRHETISRLERGRQVPLAPTILALAAALSVDPQQFIRDDPHGVTQLTVAAAAERLEVPPDRLQTWLRQGWLEGTKVSGQWRISAIVVAELIRSRRLRGRSRRMDPRFRG